MDEQARAVSRALDPDRAAELFGVGPVHQLEQLELESDDSHSDITTLGVSYPYIQAWLVGVESFQGAFELFDVVQNPYQAILEVDTDRIDG
jgi:hypothetical protein